MFKKKKCYVLNVLRVVKFKKEKILKIANFVAMILIQGLVKPVVKNSFKKVRKVVP